MNQEKKELLLIAIVAGVFIAANAIGIVSNNKLIWAALDIAFVIGLVPGCKLFMKIFKMGIYADKKDTPSEKK